MAKSTKRKPKQEPPVAFRPGPDLERLVLGFASGRGVAVNDAYKQLAALAVVGLDGSYYDLLAQLAARLTGRHAFMRAVVHVHAALDAVVRVDPLYAREPARMRFVITTVMGQLPDADEGFLTELLRPLLVRHGLSGANLAQGVSATEDVRSASTESARQKIRLTNNE